MARARTNSARLDLRDLVNPAGALTLARLPLALVFAVWADRPAVALGLYAAAVVSDLLDGPVARATGTTSQVGSLLDGFLDKVFHVNAAWALVLADIIPAWWMLCWFSRELVQLPMVPWLWSPFWHGRVQAHHADRAGKALSVALAVAFFAVLLRPWWPGLGWIASTLTPAVGAVGVAVGCAYILRSRRLQGPPSVALQAPG